MNYNYTEYIYLIKIKKLNDTRFLNNKLFFVFTILAKIDYLKVKIKHIYLFLGNFWLVCSQDLFWKSTEQLTTNSCRYAHLQIK